MRRRIIQAAGPYDELLSIVRRRKLKWFGHVTKRCQLSKSSPTGYSAGRKGERKAKKNMGDGLKRLDRDE